MPLDLSLTLRDNEREIRFLNKLTSKLEISKAKS